ncbi:MAG: hypothetical protein KDD85_00505 [Parvularculaceae bacterium]|nr:hypothetical protein [Parvularculaceae bacterium]
MIRTAIIAFVAATLSPAAHAADFMAAKALCAEALAQKTGRTLDDANTRLVKARDGGVLKVTVSVKFEDGEKSFGECKVRRGEVLSVTPRARV